MLSKSVYGRFHLPTVRPVINVSVQSNKLSLPSNFSNWFLALLRSRQKNHISIDDHSGGKTCGDFCLKNRPDKVIHNLSLLLFCSSV